MPYIKIVPPAEASGTLKEVYSVGGGPSAARGKVAMVRQREMIATVVSATNHCSY